MQSSLTPIIEAAKGVLKACGYFADHLWHVDDIHFLCEQLRLPPIDDEEAMEVFVIAHERRDGENSLSWPQLEEALRILLQRKKTLAPHDACPV